MKINITVTNNDFEGMTIIVQGEAEHYSDNPEDLKQLLVNLATLPKNQSEKENS